MKAAPRYLGHELNNKANRSTTIVLVADAGLALGVALLAYLFFKLEAEYLVLFVIVTLLLGSVVSALLRIDSGQEEARNRSDGSLSIVTTFEKAFL